MWIPAIALGDCTYVRTYAHICINTLHQYRSQNDAESQTGLDSHLDEYIRILASFPRILEKIIEPLTEVA